MQELLQAIVRCTEDRASDCRCTWLFSVNFTLHVPTVRCLSKHLIFFTFVDCALGIEESEIFGRQFVMHDNTPHPTLLLRKVCCAVVPFKLFY
jgi:hypothetical protein